MLILTRHVDQSIIIGDDIIVKILSNSGGQVKIGIDAPKEISVHRDEIYKKIQQSKLGAIPQEGENEEKETE